MYGLREMGKVFVDTSVIIRFFVDGDKKLLDLFETNKEVHIPLPILFETIFVLEKVYKVPKQNVISQVSNLLIQKNVVTDKLSKKIMSLYKSRQKLSVVDCYALAYCKNSGIKLETNDKDLARAV